MVEKENELVVVCEKIKPVGGSRQGIHAIQGSYDGNHLFLKGRLSKLLCDEAAGAKQKRAIALWFLLFVEIFLRYFSYHCVPNGV